MALGINFITQNPAIKGFNDERQQQRVQQGSDDLATIRRLQIEELGLTRDTNKAIDQVYRDAVRDIRPTGPTGPVQGPGPQQATGASALRQASQVGPQAEAGPPPAPQGPGASLSGFGGIQDRLVQGLAETPGGGEAAFGIEQSRNTAAAAKAVKALERYFEVLKTGDDPNMMRVFGNFAGIEVPDEILQNAQQRQQVAMAGEFLKFYGNDLLSFGKFFADATQNDTPQGPDYRGAFQRNPPTNQAQSSATSQDRILARTQWLRDNLGMSAREAFALAQDNPLNARSRIWTAIFKSASETSADTPEQAAAIADKLSDEFIKKFGGAGIGAIGAPGAIPGAGDQPATPEQTAAPAGTGPAGAVGAQGAAGPARPSALDRFPGAAPFPETAGIPGVNPASGVGAIEPPLDQTGQVIEAELIPGQTYNTPQGPLIWSGTGWQPAS